MSSKSVYCELCDMFVAGISEECPFHDVTTCVDMSYFTDDVELTDFIFDEVEAYGADVTDLREEWESYDPERKRDVAWEIQNEALEALPDPFVGTFMFGSLVIYKRKRA